MMGAIDCWKWKWKNFPTAYEGKYKGKKVSTITVETIVEDRFWIWH